MRQLYLVKRIFPHADLSRRCLWRLGPAKVSLLLESTLANRSLRRKIGLAAVSSSWFSGFFATRAVPTMHAQLAALWLTKAVARQGPSRVLHELNVDGVHLLEELRESGCHCNPS